MCDFGIAGKLVNSLAETNVGCKNYMAPERIISNRGAAGFGVRTDVWSLGITVVEVASAPSLSHISLMLTFSTSTLVLVSLYSVRGTNNSFNTCTFNSVHYLCNFILLVPVVKCSTVDTRLNAYYTVLVRAQTSMRGEHHCVFSLPSGSVSVLGMVHAVPAAQRGGGRRGAAAARRRPL